MVRAITHHVTKVESEQRLQRPADTLAQWASCLCLTGHSMLNDQWSYGLSPRNELIKGSVPAAYGSSSRGKFDFKLNVIVGLKIG